jgi:hypothetical protein
MKPHTTLGTAASSSMAIFSAVLLAALALLGWHVAEDVRSAR